VTEDHEYIIMGDESDELNLGIDTRTIVVDISDLDNPAESFVYTGPTAASDHNGYVKGDTYYLASYNAGMRVIDISEIGSGTLMETGYFDVYPSNDASGFNGAWSVYPYFESGNLVISVRGSDGGLFVVTDNVLGVTSYGDSNLFAITPNPAEDNFTLTLNNNSTLISVNLFDSTGRLVLKDVNSTNVNIASFNNGIYFVKVETDQGIQSKRLLKE
jgi:hypothetical protein